jgi:hypothetical protein
MSIIYSSSLAQLCTIVKSGAKTDGENTADKLVGVGFERPDTPQRIQTYCEIIWGKGDYDIDVETDDCESYIGVVKKDFGTEFGPPLTITGICNSTEQAWNELNRMLAAWATQMQTGRPMTKGETLNIFGGPNGQNRVVLAHFLVVLEKRGLE